ncbi:MAG: energy-coupling factor ABC transporter permease [Geodermatophilaceae bacterium]
MHVPDGFLTAPVSVVTGVVAAGGVAYAIRGARSELDERTAPMAGLVAAFIFATQMINFPVGAGTSGHLMGGVLAAVLVGPYTGALCVTVVLIVQALLFADGGLTALGTNVVLISLVTTFGGWALFRGLVLVLPKSRTGLLTSVGIAAFFSVPLAALAFVGLYVVGGAVDIDLGALFATMLGVHVLIGIGEALITVAVISAVLSARPDLVYGAGHLTPALTLRTSKAAA